MQTDHLTTALHRNQTTRVLAIQAKIFDTTGGGGSSNTFVWGHFSMIRPSNHHLVKPVIPGNRNCPTSQQMRTLMGLSLIIWSLWDSCLTGLCLLEADSLGLPYWVRPAVIKVMNRADLRKVRRGETSWAWRKIWIYYGEGYLMNINQVTLTPVDNLPMATGL